MEKYNNCIIELNIPCFDGFTDKTGCKIENITETKGTTQNGTKIHYFENSKIIMTPQEILNRYGTYQIIYT
jgi:hypothetical protein